MVSIAILGLVASPLLVLLSAVFRALLLVWPATVAIGALHSHIPMIPPYGWVTVFWVLVVLGLLIPTSGGLSND